MKKMLTSALSFVVIAGLAGCCCGSDSKKSAPKTHTEKGGCASCGSHKKKAAPAAVKEKVMKVACADCGNDDHKTKVS